MKFSIKTTCNSGRAGVISNIARLPNFELETPHALLYTKSGSIPHITHEVFDMMTKDKFGIHIPVPNASHIQNRMKLYKYTISEFVGLNECMSYCSFINPGEKKIPGYHDQMEISMWTRCGRKKFTAESYMQLIEDLKPDLFTVLADGDTDTQSSPKRIRRAVNCTVVLFEKCMELCQKSKVLQPNQMIGVIEGGFNEALREENSKVVGGSPVIGVAIDGLHNCSKDASEMKTDDIIPILKASLTHIPSDKLRIVHGCWNPKTLLDLIEFGIDLFDTSYPYFITEEACALIFPVNEDILENIGDESQFMSNDPSTTSELESEEAEPTAKRIKLMTKSKYYISLKDPKYIADFTPIIRNCSCLTCKNHTKAYMHHLLYVRELLGKTLLMAHNVHHYLQLLSTARKAIQAGKFQEMKRKFQLLVDGGDDTSSSP